MREAIEEVERCESSRINFLVPVFIKFFHTKSITFIGYYFDTLISYLIITVRPLIKDKMNHMPFTHSIGHGEVFLF